MKSILRFKGTITKDIEQSSIRSLLNTLYLCLTLGNEELPQDDTWLCHLRGGKPSFILKHLERQTQWIRRRSARLFFEMAQGRTKRTENRYIDLDVVRMEETSWIIWQKTKLIPRSVVCRVNRNLGNGRYTVKYLRRTVEFQKYRHRLSAVHSPDEMFNSRKVAGGWEPVPGVTFA